MHRYWWLAGALAVSACGVSTLDQGSDGADDEVTASVLGALTTDLLNPPIESEHPYRNNVVQTWKVTTPACATSFRIHFDSIDVEEHYDFLRITDSAGNKVKSYTGFFRGWSPELPGTEATLELVTDGSVTGSGFKVDAIEYTADDATGTWTKVALAPGDVISTAHPYTNGLRKSWTLKGPAGATKLRVRFKGFDTEARYDIVTLSTAELTQVATYTGKLGDFVSTEVGGNTMVVTLSSDYSITGYGFDILEYEWFAPGTTGGKCGQIPGCLSIAPNPYDFGNVKMTCSGPKQFTITNTCDAPVSLTALGLLKAAGQPAGGPNCAGTQACPEFKLTSSPTLPAGGLVIPAKSGPVTFDVLYAPIDVGVDKGEVAVESLENGKPVKYSVLLDGTGDKQGVNLDEFLQDAQPKADILFVLDNSGSMYDEQQSLAANFASFISFAQASSVDFHVAVTTTDVTTTGAAGRFVSGTTHPEKVLSPTTADLVNKFKAKVNVGTLGSADEKCFEASHRALSAALLSSDNQGFLRTDASLAVICVTDEPEQSPLDVTAYRDALFNLKQGDVNAVTYSVIGPFANPSPCHATPDTGGRFAAMVSGTNGAQEDICTPDWAKTLQNIGKTAAGYRTTFVLTSTPDLSGGKQLVVKIDGNVVNATSPTGAVIWSYDAPGNKITFAPLYTPQFGQKLTVEYSVACH